MRDQQEIPKDAVEEKYVVTEHEKSKLIRMFEIRCWPPHARRSIGGEAASLLRTHPRLSAPARGAAASALD